MRWKRLYHLQQIYSGNYIQNVITIARVLLQILQNKHFGLFFPGTVYKSLDPRLNSFNSIRHLICSSVILLLIFTKVQKLEHQQAKFGLDYRSQTPSNALVSK